MKSMKNLIWMITIVLAMYIIPKSLVVSLIVVALGFAVYFYNVKNDNKARK